MTKALETIHPGKVVRVAGDQFTAACRAGNQHRHTGARDAKVPGTAADLKAGAAVRVTTRADDKTVATGIASGKSGPGEGYKA